jgi:hypothetical protein
MNYFLILLLGLDYLLQLILPKRDQKPQQNKIKKVLKNYAID